MFLEKYVKKPESLFAKLFWNFLFGYLPFGLVHSLLCLFGVIPVKINDQFYYGPIGAGVLVLYFPIIAGSFAIVIWIFYSIGNLVLRLFVKLFSAREKGIT